MFKLLQSPEFTHTVKVQTPVNGGHELQTFQARFRVISITDSDQHNTLTSEGTKAYLREIFVGWDGVTDDEGEPVAFNDESRDRMIDVPFVRVALLETYNSAMMGAKRGN